MKISELLLERRLQKTRIMYHGTSSINLESIRASGLLPDIKQKTSWPPSYGGVYLTSSKHYATTAANHTANKFGGDPILLTVQYVMTSGGIDEDTLFDRFEWGRMVRNYIELGRDEFLTKMMRFAYDEFKKVATPTKDTRTILELWFSTVYDLAHSSGKKDLQAAASQAIRGKTMHDLTTWLIDDAKAGHQAPAVRLDRIVGFKGKTRILQIENLKTNDILYKDPHFNPTV